jgi:O-methyltransferase
VLAFWLVEGEMSQSRGGPPEYGVQAEAQAANCRRAIARESRVLVMELVIPPGNESSLSKLYDIQMLVLTGGRERREDEYRELLAAADLRLTRVIPTGV